MDCCQELRCLYISKNLVSRITGLENLKNLMTLDLSNNHITCIENLSMLEKLETLNVSRNSLATNESISHLKECQALHTLDLTNNRLETDEAILRTLSEMPALRTLSVNGNEVTKLQNFRKTAIYTITKLGYLDRPIDVQERRSATGDHKNTNTNTFPPPDNPLTDISRSFYGRRRGCRAQGEGGLA